MSISKENKIFFLVVLGILSVCTYLQIIFAGVFFSVMATLIHMACGGLDKEGKEGKGTLVCTLHADVHYQRIYKKDDKYFLELGSYLGKEYHEIYAYHEIKFSDALNRILTIYEWYTEVDYTGPKDDLDKVIDRLNA